MTSSDLQKEWQTAAGVKCTARTVRNRLLGAGLKPCKTRKKPFINERQRRARLRFAKDHKDWIRRRPGATVLQATVSRTYCEIWWRIGDDLRRVLKQGCNRADLSLWRTHESSQVKSCPGGKLAPSALTMFPNSEEWCFQQDNAPCSEVSEGVDEWPTDQDPVMASPISRPESHRKPLECDQEEDGWSQAIKQSQEWHKVTQRQCERLVESMPRLMKAVIVNHGYSTKYWSTKKSLMAFKRLLRLSDW